MLDKKDIEAIKELLQPLEKDIKEVKQNQTKHSVLIDTKNLHTIKDFSEIIDDISCNNYELTRQL